MFKYPFSLTSRISLLAQMKTIQRHVRKVRIAAVRSRKLQMLKKGLRNHRKIVASIEFGRPRNALDGLLPAPHDFVECFAPIDKLIAEHARTFDVMAAHAVHRFAGHIDDD